MEFASLNKIAKQNDCNMRSLLSNVVEEASAPD